MDKLISVIIPVYNTAQYLKRSIGSIINQTYKNLEIICINDGSTDNSLEILKEFRTNDKRIKIIDKKNEGVSSARNDGIRVSKGDYVCFMDSDDEIELNAIEILEKYMIQNDVDVVRGNYIVHNEQSNNISPETKINRKFNSEGIKSEIIPKLINGKINCYSVLLLIKKEKVKYFDENIRLMEDKVFYIDLFLSIDSVYISDNIIYHYYLNENSRDKFCKYNKENLEQSIQVYEKVKQKLIENKLYSETIKKDLATTHYKIVIKYLKALYDDSENKELTEKEINRVMEELQVNEMKKCSNLNLLNEELRKFIKIFEEK